MLDIAVNVAGHCHLRPVHHLLHLDPQQLRDVQLGEDEDRPEDEDVDGQDDNVDVDPRLRVPGPEREGLPGFRELIEKWRKTLPARYQGPFFIEFLTAKLTSLRHFPPGFK